jgi:hypothetical protein
MRKEKFRQILRTRCVLHLNIKALVNYLRPLQNFLRKLLILVLHRQVEIQGEPKFDLNLKFLTNKLNNFNKWSQSKFNVFLQFLKYQTLKLRFSLLLSSKSYNQSNRFNGQFHMLSTLLVPEYQFSCAIILKNSIIARQIFSNYTVLLFRQVIL